MEREAHPGRTPRSSAPRSRRWRTYSITGIAGLTMVVGQFAPTQCAPPAAVSPASPALQQVVDMTNAQRAAAGLPALSVDQRLSNAAQAHSDDQAARDTMSHTGSDGSNTGTRVTRQGYRWRAWGENVAMGYADAPGAIDGWMNSPGHRANILNGTYTQIGVGLAYAPDGTPYWTQVFAAPR